MAPKKSNRSLVPLSHIPQVLREIKRIVKNQPEVQRGSLIAVVRSIHKKRTRILSAVKRGHTPCYILDTEELERSIDAFKKAFEKNLPGAETFYAVKTNHHPLILSCAVQNGFGLDVSSCRELTMGLKAGAKKMAYSSPGKTTENLSFALKYRKKVTINLDSFGELKRLGALSKKISGSVRAGVRITTPHALMGSKFGIDIKDLALFWHEAKKYPNISLEGIQFHSSFNKDAGAYEEIIKVLSAYLKKSFTKKDLSEIRFIDIGGGFRPYNSEGYYPWNTPAGSIIQFAYDSLGKEAPFTDPYLLLESVPIEEYARGIATAIKKYLDPLVSCTYYLEPGRIISNNAMHVVLRVADVKSKDAVIMDGGVNAIGWERFSYDYFPVINLSRMSEKEQPCTLYGSLCLQGEMDLWGYSYYGSMLAEGDILVVPYQGCLTYSLAQNFIKDIPPVYIMK